MLCLGCDAQRGAQRHQQQLLQLPWRHGTPSNETEGRMHVWQLRVHSTHTDTQTHTQHTPINGTKRARTRTHTRTYNKGLQHSQPAGHAVRSHVEAVDGLYSKPMKQALASA